MLFRNRIFLKSFPGKGFVLAFVLFCFSSSLFSQGASPQQQAKIDSLMSYINLQLQQGKIPDQKYIDSSNAVIRSMNVQVAVKDSTGKTPSDSIKEITKQSIAGSSFTVPPGKIWRVKRLYVNDGGSYNILVTSIKFDKPLAEGEKLFTPSWVAEAELLDGDQSGFSYVFKIEESDSRK
jgi:hypothetical protein